MTRCIVATAILTAALTLILGLAGLLRYGLDAREQVWQAVYPAVMVIVFGLVWKGRKR